MKLHGKDKKSSLFLACLGVLTSIKAYQYGLGSLTSPGAGLLPFGAGLMMILLAFIVYLQAFARGAEGERELIKIGNRRIVLTAVLLILYAFTFRTFGFTATTFPLLAILFQVQERKSWFAAVVASAVTVIVSYVVFAVWLKVQLPKGIMGF
jgi:hypothetical protein